MNSEAELTLIMKARNLASREVDRLGGSLDKVKGGARAMGGALASAAKIGAIGLAAVGVAVIGLGPKLLGYAGRLEQMAAKAKTVFADQVPQVEAWAKANAAAMGLTSRQAVGLAADFGDLLVPMGFTRAEAAKMSTSVVGLSGALSQWSGGTRSAAEVSEILAKAMLGERDGLKSLGISITEADVDAQLLKNGTDKLTGAQLEQAKATATQELIFAKSKDAQDAYAKGSANLLGQQAKLDAVLAGVGETIALGLTPFLTDVMTFISDKAIPTVGRIVGRIQAWIDANQPLINQVRDVLVKVIGMAIEKIAAVVKWIGSVVAAIASNRDAMNVLRTVFAGIGEAIGLAWEALSRVVSTIANVVGAITRNKPIMKALATTWDIIAAAVRGVVDAIREVIRFGERAIGILSQLNTPSIPRSQSQYNFTQHADGGWAGLHGPELSWLGERGPEYVVPNHQLGAMATGGAGVAIVGVSERELDRIIDERMYVRIQRAVPTLSRS